MWVFFYEKKYIRNSFRVEHIKQQEANPLSRDIRVQETLAKKGPTHSIPQKKY